jgi:hypothetical protein
METILILSNYKSFPSNFLQYSCRLQWYWAGAEGLTVSAQTWVVFLYILFSISSVLIEF